MVAAAHIIVALQTIVSRQTDPRDMAVISVGAIHAGEAPNVIPDRVQMKLTVRAYRPEVRAALRERITALVQAQAHTLGVRADVDYHWRYPVTINDAAMTAFAERVAREMLGDALVIPDLPPGLPSDDFGLMLQQVPGCYFVVGNGRDGEAGGCPQHNAGYDFNDAILPATASYFVRLAQRYLA